MILHDTPCTELRFDEHTQKEAPFRAAVYCSASGCAACAFNPAEKYRRLATGKWIRKGRIWTLHFRRAKCSTTN